MPCGKYKRINIRRHHLHSARRVTLSRFGEIALFIGAGLAVPHICFPEVFAETIGLLLDITLKDSDRIPTSENDVVI